MTLYHNTSINCSKCRESGELEVYPSVNVTLNPDIKERLLSGKLLRWICPACQQTTSFSYPILYHDMDLKFMIQLFPYPDRYHR